MASLYTEPSVQPVAQLLVRAGAHCDICIIRSASVYDKQRSERERGGSKDAPEMTLYVEIKAAHIVSIHGFVHINILSLTIFQVQLCPRSSSSWCGVWVLFSSSYQCVAFRLKEYCTQTDLILSMTHLWTFLAPPLLGLHCLLFFWRMGEEPLLSWLKWLLLRRLSPMSFFFFFFTVMPRSCEEGWTPECHRYGEGPVGVVAWSASLSLVHNAVLPHWHCSHFSHLL